MTKIFITATNTDIGKTYTTLKLLEKFAKEGKKVCAIKPIETGVDKEPLDGVKLLKKTKELNPLTKDLTIKDIVPIVFKLPSAPFIASNQTTIDTKVIFEAIQKLQNLCDILLIEGAGGLYVPINKDYFMIDLIKDLEVDKTILVTHCSLGCINDTILSKKALDDAGLKNEVLFNCKDKKENFKIVSKPFFDAIGFDTIFI
jgi:dethiobiotin synthetase